MFKIRAGGLILLWVSAAGCSEVDAKKDLVGEWAPMPGTAQWCGSDVIAFAPNGSCGIGTEAFSSRCHWTSEKRGVVEVDVTDSERIALILSYVRAGDQLTLTPVHKKVYHPDNKYATIRKLSAEEARVCVLRKTAEVVAPSQRQTGAGQTPSSADHRVASSVPLESFDEAVTYIRRNFEADTAETSGSSWVTSAEYFDADHRGYLILGTTKRNYLISGVPEPLWAEFKKASSLGAFYNSRIRGRYRVLLEK
jgi:hypothetical protein